MATIEIGTIIAGAKAITDVTTKLLEKKEAKKFAGDILKIQSLVATLQSQIHSHLAGLAEMLERDLRLNEENSELRRKVDEASAEDIRIVEGVEFRKGKRTSGEWLPFCPKCHMPARPDDEPPQLAFCSAACGWKSSISTDLRSLTANVRLE